MRTRLYLADMAHEADVARAHKELFDEVRPAATMVAISGFVNKDMLIEVEVDAYRA